MTANENCLTVQLAAELIAQWGFQSGQHSHPITISLHTHAHTHVCAPPSVSVTPSPNQHANVQTLVSADNRMRGLRFRQRGG